MSSGAVEVILNQPGIDRLAYSTLLVFANRVRNNAHTRCPVLTGYLQSTIGLEEADPDVKVSATAEYAIYVHNGTSVMPARPFLTDAVRDEWSRL